MKNALGLDEPNSSTPIEAGVDAVSKHARGYSIDGLELRGYEVVAYDPNEDEKTRHWRVLYKTNASKSGLLKAEQEAKHAFNRESEKPEEKRRAIRLRYLVSMDPTTIEKVE